MIRTAYPTVTIIQQPDLKLARDAWLYSRPNETEVDLQKILKIDAPVNEFPRVTARFYAPILVREIVCSLRDHVVWARTSRVDDLDTWEVHPLAFTQQTERLYTRMRELKNAGGDQDDYRFCLPLGYMTHFTVDLSLRSWLNLAGYFGKLAQTDDHICELFAHMNHQMLCRLEPVWLRGIRYKVRDLCPPTLAGTQSQSVGSIAIAQALVPVALRAQVVRHRLFHIVDDLALLFNEESMSLPISMRMFMTVSVPVDVARTIVSKRQCWISQTDLWQPLIDELNIAIGGDRDTPILPCADGTCPYVRDNELRIEGKDPNVACPMYARLYNLPLSAADAARASVYAGKRTSAAFWRSMI